MNNFIEELEISNFKSIKNIKLDCRRINVLIGKPNVGKSNILEALSLFSAPYEEPGKKLLVDYIRYERLSNLFYFNERNNPVLVKTNLGFASLRFQMNQVNAFEVFMANNPEILTEMQSLKDIYNTDDIKTKLQLTI